MGRWWISASGFPGKREEAYLEGIIPRICFTFLFQKYKRKMEKRFLFRLFSEENCNFVRLFQIFCQYKHGGFTD